MMMERQLATHLEELRSHDLSPQVVAISAGCFAFGTSLAISTLVQCKLLGLSTGSVRPLPSLFGVLSVGVASLASHYSSIAAYQSMNGDWSMQIGKHRYHRSNSMVDTVSFGDFSVSKHTLRVCTLGLIAFKLLGGRFWGIAPSSYTHVGSFARESIPASSSYASQAEKLVLKRIGNIWGCHTCGKHIRFNRSVIADHQPPRAVAVQMNRMLWRRLFGIKVDFRFYPHCTDCSLKQGAILSSARGSFQRWNPGNLAGAGGGRRAYYHGATFRINHLTGGVVAAATVIGASESDIARGNVVRFQRWQDVLHAMLPGRRFKTNDNAGVYGTGSM